MDKIRHWYYIASAFIALLIPALTTAHLLTSDQGASLGNIVADLGGLIGAGAAGTAAVILGRQRKNGTLETDPGVIVTNAIEQAIKNASDSNAVLDKVREAATSIAVPAVEAITNEVPVLSDLVKQAIQAAKDK